ncbi:MAG: hypothetical protein IIB38_08710, partial [Candidatus Hydrogenedentes bacterium]|nr:hypothetical protein [Candidatus Hydrogenedentota bacterium]
MCSTRELDTLILSFRGTFDVPIFDLGGIHSRLMTPDDRHEPLGLEERTPREGAFDAQLSFPAPFAPVAQPIATVIKRDGRREKFDTQKIAGAIFLAADSLDVGDADLSRGLASAVAIYLNKHLKGDTPRVDD